MALSSLHFSQVKRVPLGAGRWMVTGLYSPGASGQAGGTHSYTSGGEVLTQAIWKSATGLNEINTLNFSSILKSDYTQAGRISFDHARTANQLGVIHIYDQVSAHTHSFLVKGGTAAAGTDAINIKSTVIGKEAASDATNTGTTNGGVQNSSQTTVATEVGAASAYTGYTSRFIAYGR